MSGGTYRGDAGGSANPVEMGEHHWQARATVEEGPVKATETDTTPQYGHLLDQ